jgi:transcriptional antiterminator RfaH
VLQVEMNRMDETAGGWYVIRSKPRAESIAQAQLERQGFRAYFPRVLQPTRVRGRWMDRIEPLFPRYLFLHLVSGGRSLAPVRSTVGVSEIVRFGAEYATVPNRIVQQLMNQADTETGVHELRQPLFTRGTHVRIAEGPFNGLEGIFECQEGEERVLILLEVLGRQTRVSLSVDQVVPLAV